MYEKVARHSGHAATAIAIAIVAANQGCECRRRRAFASVADNFVARGAIIEENKVPPQRFMERVLDLLCVARAHPSIYIYISESLLASKRKTRVRPTSLFSKLSRAQYAITAPDMMPSDSRCTSAIRLID